MKGSQFFNKPITEIISNRTSIRNYKPDEISKKLRDQLINYIRDVKGPFNEKVDYVLIDKSNVSDSNSVKIGTYGVIKGGTILHNR